MAENQQLENNSFSHVESVRKEVEGKIEKLDDKMEKKISEKWFFWIVGGLIVIAGTILSYFAYEISAINTKVDTLNDKVIVVDTKMDGMKK